MPKHALEDFVTAAVSTAIDNLIAGAPGALDTLNELAAALGDDAAFSTAVTNALAGKVSLSGNETVDGVKTFSSDPVIPDEAYDGTAWNGVLEPTTKNAVRDMHESHLTDPSGAHAASAISTSGATPSDVQTILDDLVSLTSSLEADLTAIPESIDGDRIAFTLDSELNTLTIDVDLSLGKSGGDTLIGGSDAGDDLLLASTSNSVRGNILLRDQAFISSEDKTWTDSSTAFQALGMVSTVTMDGTTAGNTVKLVDLSPSVVWDANPYGFAIHSFLTVGPNISNAGTESRTMGTHAAFFDEAVFTSNTGAMSGLTYSSFSASPNFATSAGGTLGVTSDTAFAAIGGQVTDGVTVTTRTGLAVSSLGVAGTGSIGTFVGVDVGVLSGATLQIGARIIPPMVHPSAVSTLSAATSTIRIDKAVVRLNNTSGGTLTMSNTPIIADGQEGQILTLFNSSANTVAIRDHGTYANSGIRLTAGGTWNIAQYGTLQLIYSTNTGEWMQI